METKLTPTYQPDIYKSDFPDFGSRLVLGTSGLGGVWGEVNEDKVLIVFFTHLKTTYLLLILPHPMVMQKYIWVRPWPNGIRKDLL